MNDIPLFYFLAVHILICLIYFGVNLKFNGLQDSFSRFILVLFLPILGIIFLIISAIVDHAVKRTGGEMESYLKSIHKEDFIHFEDNVEFEKEINTVPMQDSLQFNDNKTKRSYLIYILKKNLEGHIKSLKKALKNDDTETSHYAAAALMEIKKQFDIMIQKARENYEKEKENLEVVKHYADTLKKYLISEIDETIDRYEYLNRFSSLLEEILKKDRNNEVYFEDKISADISLQDYESAFKHCKDFIKNFPDSERPCISILKLFYTVKDYDSFFNILGEIKARKINTGGNLEKIINFWEDSRACF